jgi:uncharacterized membrane protein (Fun14 family)
MKPTSLASSLLAWTREDISLPSQNRPSGVGVDLQIVALQAVGGFTVGALVGYVCRKLGKYVLLGLGLLLLPLVVFWQMGVFQVNWAMVNEMVGRFVTWLAGNVRSMSDALASAGVFGLSSLVGFLFGLASPGMHSCEPSFTSNEMRFVKRKGFVRAVRAVRAEEDEEGW